MKLMELGRRKSNASGILINPMKKKWKKVEFAVCIRNTDYPASLELHKIYPMIPDDDAEGEGDIRIIDESG